MGTKNKDPRLNNSTFNKVWDIEKNGRRLLDLEKSNLVAEKNLERGRNIMGFLLIISIVIFFFNHPKQTKPATDNH